MRFSRYWFTCLTLLLPSLFLCGCNAGTRYPGYFTPNGFDAFNHESVQQQRNQAVRYDPYIDNDIGPEVDGGRPRDYGQQLPEAVRARWTR